MFKRNHKILFGRLVELMYSQEVEVKAREMYKGEELT